MVEGEQIDAGRYLVYAQRLVAPWFAACAGRVELAQCCSLTMGRGCVAARAHARLNRETPTYAEVSDEADEGTRTLDLLHGKQTL